MPMNTYTIIKPDSTFKRQYLGDEISWNENGVAHINRNGMTTVIIPAGMIIEVDSLDRT